MPTCFESGNDEFAKCLIGTDVKHVEFFSADVHTFEVDEASITVTVQNHSVSVSALGVTDANAILMFVHPTHRRMSVSLPLAGSNPRVVGVTKHAFRRHHLMAVAII